MASNAASVRTTSRSDIDIWIRRIRGELARTQGRSFKERYQATRMELTQRSWWHTTRHGPSKINEFKNFRQEAQC